ncbi:MAG TPA: S8 family serine peptidase [Pilimelia sp.]|nr:S8 family serine peptidase [Pilimelia sp.]
MDHGDRRAAVLAAAVVGALLAPAGPASAGPASAAPEPGGDPVSLVVGVHAGVDPADPAARLSARPGVDVLASGQVGALAAATVEVPSGDAAEAAAALRRDPAVRYVVPDHRAGAAAVTANDPYRSLQWGLDRATVPGAWQYGTGSTAVTVAVLDTGVTATGDLAGALLPGWDFVNADADASDDSGHGTMVAGIIADRGDDGQGLAGVCWSCRILPVKVLGANGLGSYSDIAAGIVWAADQGAHVINLSLGGAWDSPLLREAASYAAGRGALLVAAAGNSGTTAAQYPAAIPGVLAVSASTVDDRRYAWANHGSAWVDLAAPGCAPATGPDGQLYEFCGTSAATPLVAGVAGLARASNPDVGPHDVAAALTDGAAPLSGGWVRAGRLDALRAVQALPAAVVTGAPTLTVTGPAPHRLVRGTITVTATAAAPGGISRVELLANGAHVGTDATPPYAVTLPTAGLPRQSSLTVLAYGADARVVALAVPVTVDNVAPAVALRGPGHLAHVRGTVAVPVSATDASGIARVELLVGRVVVATDHSAPFAPAWRSGRVNGPATLVVRAFDRAGNVRSVTRRVVVDNTAPTVRWRTAPDSRRAVRGTLRFTAAATDDRGVGRVELLVDGAVVATDRTAPYTFALRTAGRPRTFTVRLRAYDRAGNVRTSPAVRYRRG